MKTLRDYIHYYLPYGVQMKTKAIFKPNRNEQSKIKGASATLTPDLYADILNGTYDTVGRFRILLKPLSDLTKEIEVNGERFVPVVKLEEMKEEFYIQARQLQEDQRWLNQTSFLVIEKLLSWHFNVFDLPEDQWINVNELEK